MKLGFVSAILDGWTFEEMIDTAAEMGYECVEVACEDDSHHRHEDNYRKSLKRLVQLLGDSWIVVSTEHSENKWNSHDDHYALEDFPERHLKIWQ